ncbi:MAG: hypothetical protein CME06_09420 [Gemmatimonadetes bacterium]|nr:hypothetical protein [Gemmatimonadota bacterium]
MNMGMDGSWWASRTSTPVPGANTVRGGFDSHTFPPSSSPRDEESEAAGRRAPRPAAFLDRDGTLIELVDYPRDPEQVRLCSGAQEGLARLRSAGFALVVVTNQSGIARGLVTEAERAAVDSRMIELLGPDSAPDLILFCPHLPELTGPCSCRKPKIGMIREAERRLALDLDRSYLVGDSPADIESGRRAGLRTVQVATGYGSRDLDPALFDFYPPDPDARSAGLAEACAWILEDAAVRWTPSDRS